MLRVIGIDETDALNDEDEKGEDEDDRDRRANTRELQESKLIELYSAALHQQTKGCEVEALEIYHQLLDGLTTFWEDDGPPSTSSSYSSSHQRSHHRSNKVNSNNMIQLWYLGHKNRAQIYQKEKRIDEAIQDFVKALEIDDSDVSVWSTLGRLAMSVNRYGLARLALEAALHRDPKHPIVLRKLCELLFILKDYQRCEELLDVLLVSSSKDELLIQMKLEVMKAAGKTPYELQLVSGTVRTTSASITHLQSLQERRINDQRASLHREEIPVVTRILDKPFSWLTVGNSLLETLRSRYQEADSNPATLLNVRVRLETEPESNNTTFDDTPLDASASSLSSSVSDLSSSTSTITTSTGTVSRKRTPSLHVLFGDQRRSKRRLDSGSVSTTQTTSTITSSSLTPSVTSGSAVWDSGLRYLTSFEGTNIHNSYNSVSQPMEIDSEPPTPSPSQTSIDSQQLNENETSQVLSFVSTFNGSTVIRYLSILIRLLFDDRGDETLNSWILGNQKPEGLAIRWNNDLRALARSIHAVLEIYGVSIGVNLLPIAEIALEVDSQIPPSSSAPSLLLSDSASSLVGLGASTSTGSVDLLMSSSSMDSVASLALSVSPSSVLPQNPWDISSLIRRLQIELEVMARIFESPQLKFRWLWLKARWEEKTHNTSSESGGLFEACRATLEEELNRKTITLPHCISNVVTFEDVERRLQGVLRSDETEKALRAFPESPNTVVQILLPRFFPPSRQEEIREEFMDESGASAESSEDDVISEDWLLLPVPLQEIRYPKAVSILDALQSSLRQLGLIEKALLCLDALLMRCDLLSDENVPKVESVFEGIELTLSSPTFLKWQRDPLRRPRLSSLVEKWPGRVVDLAERLPMSSKSQKSLRWQLAMSCYHLFSCPLTACIPPDGISYFSFWHSNLCSKRSPNLSSNPSTPSPSLGKAVFIRPLTPSSNQLEVCRLKQARLLKLFLDLLAEKFDEKDAIRHYRRRLKKSEASDYESEEEKDSDEDTLTESGEDWQEDNHKDKDRLSSEEGENSSQDPSQSLFDSKAHQAAKAERERKVNLKDEYNRALYCLYGIALDKRGGSSSSSSTAPSVGGSTLGGLGLGLSVDPDLKESKHLPEAALWVLKSEPAFGVRSLHHLRRLLETNSNDKKAVANDISTFLEGLAPFIPRPKLEVKKIFKGFLSGKREKTDEIKERQVPRPLEKAKSDEALLADFYYWRLHYAIRVGTPVSKLVELALDALVYNADIPEVWAQLGALYGEQVQDLTGSQLPTPKLLPKLQLIWKKAQRAYSEAISMEKRKEWLKDVGMVCYKCARFARMMSEEIRSGLLGQAKSHLAAALEMEDGGETGSKEEDWELNLYLGKIVEKEQRGSYPSLWLHYYRTAVVLNSQVSIGGKSKKGTKNKKPKKPKPADYRLHASRLKFLVRFGERQVDEIVADASERGEPSLSMDEQRIKLMEDGMQKLRKLKEGESYKDKYTYRVAHALYKLGRISESKTELQDTFKKGPHYATVWRIENEWPHKHMDLRVKVYSLWVKLLKKTKDIEYFWLALTKNPLVLQSSSSWLDYADLLRESLDDSIHQSGERMVAESPAPSVKVPPVVLLSIHEAYQTLKAKLKTEKFRLERLEKERERKKNKPGEESGTTSSTPTSSSSSSSFASTAKSSSPPNLEEREKEVRILEDAFQKLEVLLKRGYECLVADGKTCELTEAITYCEGEQTKKKSTLGINKSRTSSSKASSSVSTRPVPVVPIVLDDSPASQDVMLIE